MDFGVYIDIGRILGYYNINRSGFIGWESEPGNPLKYGDNHITQNKI